MSRRRRQSRLADLEWRATARAKDDAALMAERVRSLTDAELSALVAHYDARPDLEFMAPEHFCTVLNWPHERAIAFFSRKTEQFQ
jgi:hypothetical protein